MKRLQSYHKNGHSFEIAARIDKFAVFHGKSNTGNSETFEIIEIQSHQGRTIGNLHFDPAEYPPSNAQWGSKGWTKPTLELAIDKLKQLTNTNQ